MKQVNIYLRNLKYLELNQFQFLSNKMKVFKGKLKTLKKQINK
jgi:hypothetical protein